ncbi:MAG: hypothetical protein ABEI74_04785 [Candidatus Pacearchaeota archaeon]
MRIRKIRNWGGQLVIGLREMDSRELNLESGDEVDIEDIVKITNKPKKKKSK